MHRTIQWTLSFFACAAALSAQATTAQITGKITDPSGAVIPDVAVAISNVDTGIRRDTKSNEVGNYAAALLPPGSYRITLQKEGFKPVSRAGVTLQVDQAARLDFVLELGGVSEVVEVTAAAPLLDQETSSLGQVIDNQKILAMPLNGRMTFRMVQLTPGVLTTPGSAGQFGDISVGTFDDVHFSINGGRAQSNEVMVDGVPSTTGFLNLFTTIPSVDATQEFKVQSSNMSAEWGRFSGGVINVSTRSGTNKLHGTLYEFVRNSAFDANEFFNRGAGRDIPPFRMNQFGGAAGGPLSLGKLYDGKNRTFFFADYQGTRWRRGDIYITTVPTALERQGDFSRTRDQLGQSIVIYDPSSTRANPAQPGQTIRDPFPGNVLPQNRTDRVGRSLVGFYPLPNAAGDPVTNVQNFVSNASRRIDNGQWSGRLDHQVTAAWKMFGRLAMTRNQLGQPDHFNGPATPGVGANGNIKFRYHTAALDNTVTVNPSTLFNLRYGFARFFWSRQTRSYGFDQTSLGMPASVVNQFQIPVFPATNVEGFSAMGGGSYLVTGQDTHSLLPSVTRIMGRHNMKAGADVRLRRNNIFVVSGGGGTYNFNRAFTRGPNPNLFTTNAGSGIASLLLGVGSGSVNVVPGVSLQNWYFAGYLQDDIRVSSKLTLNLGLRYETESPYTERRDQLAWFDFNVPSPARNAAFPDLSGGLLFVNTEGHSRYPYAWDRNNFAPRFGLAYSVTPRTVFRAGIGLFYSPLETNNNLNAFSPAAGTGYSATTPFVGSLDGLRPFNLLSNPYPDGLVQPVRNTQGLSTLLGQAATTFDYAALNPYVIQWNADLQRQVTDTLLVDIAYSASHGVKLARGYNRNALDPQYLSLGAGLQQLVDNPFFGAINVGALAQPRVARQQLLRPFPQFNGVDVINSGSANSIYHSMQLKVQKRVSEGVSLLMSYTAGKLISDSYNALAVLGTQNNSTGVQNWYDLRGERSISEMDMPQALTLSYVADLPFGKGRRFFSGGGGVGGKLIEGWQLSGIVTARSGIPLQMSAPIVSGGNRPNSAGRSAAIEQDRARGEKIARWFDTTAFLLPGPFTMGDVSRTLPDVRGPGFLNFDLSLVKSTRIRELADLQFRAEAFNVANRPHLWLPNTAFGSLQFGRITATQSSAQPRVLQFALKLSF